MGNVRTEIELSSMGAKAKKPEGAVPKTEEFTTAYENLCMALNNLYKNSKLLGIAIQDLGIDTNNSEEAKELFAIIKNLATSIASSPSEAMDTATEPELETNINVEISRISEALQQTREEYPNLRLDDIDKAMTEMGLKVAADISRYNELDQSLTALIQPLLHAEESWNTTKNVANISATTLAAAVGALTIYTLKMNAQPMTELGDLLKSVGVDGLGGSMNAGLAAVGITSALAIIIGFAVCQGVKSNLASKALAETLSNHKKENPLGLS